MIWLKKWFKTGSDWISLYFDVDIFAFWKSFDAGIYGFQNSFDVCLLRFPKIWLLFLKLSGNTAF